MFLVCNKCCDGKKGLSRRITLVRMVELGPLLEGDIQTEHRDKKELSLERVEKSIPVSNHTYTSLLGNSMRRPACLGFSK